MTGNPEKKPNNFHFIFSLLFMGWVGFSPVAAHPASISFSGEVIHQNSSGIYPDSGIVYTFLDQAGLQLRTINHGTSPQRFSFAVRDQSGASIPANIFPQSTVINPLSEIEISVVISMNLNEKRVFKVCAIADGNETQHSCGNYTAVRVK